MPVTEIKTADEFNTAIKGDKPVVVDFWAPWCGPCKMIGPIFKKMADMPDFSAVQFASVNTDELESVMEQCNVQAMPTFLLFHKGEQVGMTKGAIPMNLQNLVKQGAKLTETPEAEAPAPAA